MNADDETVREAEAWFRKHPERVEEVRGGENLFMVTAAQRHAATIVRAWLARDVPAPAGRDLTAQDIRDSYLLLMEQGAPENENRQFVADYLSRIARPSGGVGQQRKCIHPELDGPCSGCAPRSWSLSAPPPDDVTVVHVQAGDEVMRCVRDGYHWRDESGGSLYGFGELLDLGDVVEGEPPAPEPQAAEPPRFERGFYRLARDLDPDNGYEIVPAGLAFVSRVDEDGTAFVNTADVSTRTTVAALAVAGAERTEDL